MPICRFQYPILIACTPQADTADGKKLRKWLQERNIPLTGKAYVFFPVNSCGYCAQKTEEFISKNGEVATVQVIASGYTEQEIRNVLGNKADWQNIHLDILNEAYRDGVVDSRNTTIILMDQGYISKKLAPFPNEIDEALGELEEWMGEGEE